jgi:hypothetical protein
MGAKTWTKAEYQQEINQLHHEMKKHGWTKADCKRNIDALVKDEKITVLP